MLVNPGGESLAIEALRAGAELSIAEGDPIALRALAGDERAIASRTNAILEAYEARIGKPISGGGSSQRRRARQPGHRVCRRRPLWRPRWRLRRRSRCCRRASSRSRYPALADPGRMRMSAEAATLLHRRLAALFKQICQGHGDLFDLGDGAFALLLAPGMTGRGGGAAR